jgi:hypothetical protein
MGIVSGSFVRRRATVAFSPAFQGRDHEQVNLLRRRATIEGLFNRRSRDDGNCCEPFLALKGQAKVNRRSATKKELPTITPLPAESA